MSFYVIKSVGLISVLAAFLAQAGPEIPGRIEFENFDGGGEGVAWHDDQQKHGLPSFRPESCVDVERTVDVDGQYNIGWTTPGEWLKYTVRVKKDGLYTPRIRLTSVLNSSVVIEGKPKGEKEFKPLATVPVPSTGGIKSWKTVVGPALELEDGELELRFILGQGGMNLNWVEFAPGGEISIANQLRAKLKGKTPDEQAEAVLELMTFEEKARLCIGGGILNFEGVPRLGIEPMNCTDGPRGPKHPQGTAFPAGPGQSASWNTQLMREMGAVWGKECRASGGRQAGVLLGPALNILRDPLGGRFFEYYTEDPFLNGALTVPVVEGVQSQNVAACLKHYVANNREANRGKYISHMDERTLREIYLPGFRMGVEAGAWTVMTGANGAQIEGKNDRGLLLSDNRFLLTDILKNEWGFKGFVLTDWCGTRSTELAANAGLDVSMPWRGGPGYYQNHLFGQPLLDAVEAGRVPKELVEDKARRVLRVVAFAGMLDGSGGRLGAVEPANHKVALEMAEESAVLLKNDGLLPFDRAAMKEILVVGPNADQFFCGPLLGGSSGAPAKDEVTVLRGIREAAGSRVQVTTLDLGDLFGFRPITARDLVVPADGRRGFQAEYRKSRDAQPVYSETVDAVDFVWEMRSPDVDKLGMDHFHCAYMAQINPPVSGLYTLRLRADDRATIKRRLNGGGAPLAFVSTETGGEAFATVEMKKGEPFDIRIDYEERTGDAFCQLSWVLPGDNPGTQAAFDRMKTAASKADAVVFAGGLDHGQDTEGNDRMTMDFPSAQTRIIHQLAEVNSNLCVVLINGSPVVLSDWLDEVPAVLESWYNGESAGTAVGRILFGDVNPSGRLPFTWPNTLEETPAHAVGRQNIDHIYYKEGIYVGYRYYDKQGIRPQFPFGHGLSYTRFDFSDLQVEPSQDPGYPLTATVTVKNTGAAAGKEVVQIYAGDCESSADQPVKELAGFTKINLKPGEAKTVRIPLHWTAFKFFDEAAGAWTFEPGEFRILAARSAAEPVLETAVNLTEL
jgi:beta-glucosidase